MAQGGGISSFGERPPSPVKHPAGDGNAAALDGSFLLQLLQKKPQGPPSSSSHPLIFHESLPPYHDPAVAAIGPGFPFLPHSLFSRPQPTGFSPPSWSPPSFSPPDVANRNLSRGRQFFPMEDQKIGFLPSGASPPNPAPVNCYNGWNSPRSPREGILASNRTKNLGEKNVSNFRFNQEERASIRPPPGFSKAVSVGLDEFTRKMEGDAGSQIASVGSKQQCTPHSYNDGSTSRIEERRGVPAFKKSQRLHSQNSRFESQGGTHWNGRNLDNDDAPNRGLPNGYSAYRQRHRQFAYSDPIMNNCDFTEEKDSGESDKDFVDNEIDEQGLRTFEELICAETGQFSLRNSACSKEDLLGKQLTAALSDNSRKEAKNSSRLGSKDSRMDFFRGHHVSSQRFRIQRRELRSRHDLDSFIPCFLSIFKSLVPSEDEVIKQGQVLKFLRKLVKSEWPDAELHLYGSCANSFGVSNSDIDICLAINDHEISKLDILLKLANILESSNLQNVQALTRARVPIVKMMDPVTGKSCDICINNLLAVVNSKLLKDYAQIDQRLRQLAFIVKHWAKSRRVNETYQGTLSSYAYVLMCIHFLQTRKPAILPCLQGMEATYRVTVDGTECAYFDKVEKLHNFGAQNKESIMQLVWAFFNYWAFHHDYTNQVISVRTGSVISKKEKDWTRRIGNDRHLICIEDPFEVSHDLGRVVDKFSIKVLREEFERAADILQYDLNPSVALFDPYVLGPPSSFDQNETEELASLVPAENVI